MRKTIFAILLALALVLIPVGNAFAASSVDVYVYAEPLILSLTVAPTSWYINDAGPLAPPYGDNRTRADTLYFSNPLGDNITPDVVGAGTTDNTECLFLFTNNSGGGYAIDIFCSMGDFTTGDMMQNGGGGYAVNGDNIFGASAYVSGTAWPAAAVTLSYTDNLTVNALADTLDIWWGVALLTQQDGFSTAGTMTSTITCTAAEDV